MRHSLLILLVPLLSITGRTLARKGPTDPGRPNVLVFMVDDLGWQDTSLAFHTERTPFNERYQTPHLEALAARGVRFTSAYAAAPVCTPTRTSLMTGRAPARTHITYWTLYADRDQSADFPGIRAPAWNMNALQEDDVTLPGLLKAAGYRTIHAGKAHFGAKGTSGADPLNLGFDVNIAGHAAGGPASYYGTRNFAKNPGGEPSVWDVPGLEAHHGKEIYLTEALTIEASTALAQAVAADLPFFLHFAPYAVHAPIQANARYLENYGELDAREAAYATMVESYDAALGALVAELEELKVLENTIIVFTSDNGGLSAHARGGEPHTHNLPLRSGKGSAYEGGLRIPQVIAWPGVTDSARTIDTPVITYDLFPTILDWTGVGIPDEIASDLDGESLIALVRDQEALPARVLGWHQPHFWGVQGPGIWPFTALRHENWKLIFRHGDRGFELYDLARDLGEARDLATAQPQRVAELAELMSRWCEATGAQLSIDKESNEPIALPRQHVLREHDPEGGV